MNPAPSFTTHDDNELLALVAAGDAGGPLEELYHRFERRLYSLGRKMLNEDGLAQELVQETFVRLWRSAQRFDPEKGTASAFIFAVARNIAIDLYRRPSSRPYEELPRDAVHADEVDRILAGLTVREAMEQLTEQQREVLELVYAQQRRAAEVAQKLGVPVATVRTRAFYALRALEKSLGRMGFDPSWAAA
jgi:RNA polymerase sigma-70 factor (ECF subfamily)